MPQETHYNAAYVTRLIAAVREMFPDKNEDDMKLKLCTNTTETRLIISLNVDTDTFLHLRESGLLAVIDGDVINF